MNFGGTVPPVILHRELLRGRKPSLGPDGLRTSYGGSPCPVPVSCVPMSRTLVPDLDPLAEGNSLSSCLPVERLLIPVSPPACRRQLLCEAPEAEADRKCPWTQESVLHKPRWCW